MTRLVGGREAVASRGGCAGEGCAITLLLLGALLGGLSTEACDREDVATAEKSQKRNLSITGYPVINVQASQARGTLAFGFKLCTSLRHRASLERIEVLRSRQGAMERPAICTVEMPKPLRADLMRFDKWQYGTTPKGWTRRGDCPPLTAGEYTVGVLGSGSGVRTFTIDGNAKFAWTSPECQ